MENMNTMIMVLKMKIPTMMIIMKMTPCLEYDLVGESLILQKVILVPEI